MTQPVGPVYGLSGGGYLAPPGSPGPQVVNGAYVGNGAVPVGNPTSGAPGASLSSLNAPQGQQIAQQYAAGAGPRPAPPRPMPAAMPTGAAPGDFTGNVRLLMQNLQRLSLHNAAGPTQPIATWTDPTAGKTKTQAEEMGGQGDDGLDPELAAFDKAATADGATAIEGQAG
jgi:hypothetical protein